MRDRHEWRDRGRIHGRRCQRVHVGAESGYEGWPGHRRNHSWRNRAERTSADHLPASCGPATGLLQPDPWPARQSLCRSHAGSGVRVRRGPRLHDLRIWRTDNHERSGFRHVRHHRYHACRGCAHQHRRAQRHRSSAVVYRRYRDVLQLDGPRAQSVPARGA